MSRVRIFSESGGAAYGTQIEIDGKPVENVRAIRVDPITVDSLLAVQIDVLPSESFEMELDASVAARTTHVSECPRCTAIEKWPRRRRRPFGVRLWTEVSEVTHLRSPGAHVERRSGARRASFEIRIPVWLADWWINLGRGSEKKAAA